MIHLNTMFWPIVFIAINIIQFIVSVENNQQILFTICIKPNLIIDQNYLIWTAVIEENPYKVFKKKNKSNSILILLHFDVNIQSKIFYM